jgi:hypothetical protein
VLFWHVYHFCKVTVDTTFDASLRPRGRPDNHHVRGRNEDEHNKLEDVNRKKEEKRKEEKKREEDEIEEKHKRTLEKKAKKDG